MSELVAGTGAGLGAGTGAGAGAGAGTGVGTEPSLTVSRDQAAICIAPT